MPPVPPLPPWARSLVKGVAASDTLPPPHEEPAAEGPSRQAAEAAGAEPSSRAAHAAMAAIAARAAHGRVGEEGVAGAAHGAAGHVRPAAGRRAAAIRRYRRSAVRPADPAAAAAAAPGHVVLERHAGQGQATPAHEQAAARGGLPRAAGAPCDFLLPEAPTVPARHGVVVQPAPPARATRCPRRSAGRRPAGLRRESCRPGRPR